MAICNSETPFDPSILPDPSGKVHLVTGGNAGIGYQTALVLAQHNATVYIGCRSSTKGQAAITSIKSLVPDAKLHLLILDHVDLSSVVSAAKEFASKEQKLHGLINNAAKASQPCDVRIVNITSGGHNFAPKSGIDFEDIKQVNGGLWSRYGQSKLGNILHLSYLNSLYGPNGSLKEQGEIWTAAVHPGNVYTDLNKKAKFMGALSGVFAKALDVMGVYISKEEGAYTSLFAAASEQFRGEQSGGYFVPLGKEGKASKKAVDAELSGRLWRWSEEEMKRKGLC